MIDGEEEGVRVWRIQARGACSSMMVCKRGHGVCKNVIGIWSSESEGSTQR